MSRRSAADRRGRAPAAPSKMPPSSQPRNHGRRVDRGARQSSGAWRGSRAHTPPCSARLGVRVAVSDRFTTLTPTRKRSPQPSAARFAATTSRSCSPAPPPRRRRYLRTGIAAVASTRGARKLMARGRAELALADARPPGQRRASDREGRRGERQGGWRARFSRPCPAATPATGSAAAARRSPRQSEARRWSTRPSCGPRRCSRRARDCSVPTTKPRIRRVCSTTPGVSPCVARRTVATVPITAAAHAAPDRKLRQPPPARQRQQRQPQRQPCSPTTTPPSLARPPPRTTPRLTAPHARRPSASAPQATTPARTRATMSHWLLDEAKRGRGATGASSASAGVRDPVVRRAVAERGAGPGDQQRVIVSPVPAGPPGARESPARRGGAGETVGCDPARGCQKSAHSPCPARAFMKKAKWDELVLPGHLRRLDPDRPGSRGDLEHRGHGQCRRDQPPRQPTGSVARRWRSCRQGRGGESDRSHGQFGRLGVRDRAARSPRRVSGAHRGRDRRWRFPGRCSATAPTTWSITAASSEGPSWSP